MRLRITVRRHCLPETPIIWNVDSGSSTVAQLLEKINEVIPIESGEWGLEDYAVDLKGSSGINYECLHFQQVGKVMKEDDEVIIRPLLAQDLKIRKVSGRLQITSDARHLVDGLPFGRPLLRRPAADRPAINIPPRKRARITYNEDEDGREDEVPGLLLREEPFKMLSDQESTQALTEIAQKENRDSGHENHTRQLVLHANFEDDDSEDDEEYVPGEDEEDDEVEHSEADENGLETQRDQEELIETAPAVNGENTLKENDLNDIPDEETRRKIHKLHSAYPTSPLAVCKHVLTGSGGNMGEAFKTMSLGFQPSKVATAIAQNSEVSLLDPKPRSKKRKACVEETEDLDSMQLEGANTADSLLLEHYDQNGLPPGSIASGKALSRMADAAQCSPDRRTIPGGSESVISNKSVRFSLDSELKSGHTSNPATIQVAVIDDSEEESDVSSSDATSSSGSSSSEGDSSSSDESSEDDDEASETSSSASDSGSDSSNDDDVLKQILNKAPNANTADSTEQEIEDTSSSGSDSAADNDSPSDDDAPPETSSKSNNAKTSSTVTVVTKTITLASTKLAPLPPGSGKKSTIARNKRRRHANALNRYKQKGILPAGTTLTEFTQLSGVTYETSPEDALAELEALRAAKSSAEPNEKLSLVVEQSEEFEARRHALFTSLEEGVIEVGPEPPEAILEMSKASSTKAQNHSKLIPSLNRGGDLEIVSDAYPIASEIQQPEAMTPLLSIPLSKLGIPSTNEPSEVAAPKDSITYSKSLTPPSGENLSSSTSLRRARLNLSAGRRMLFGALGIRAPKSKDDEERVRSDLMKNVRPLLTPKVAETSPKEGGEVIEVEDEDLEAWREKISYRAVECCYDGIDLSEPPFPFVQRWDPQQQGRWPQTGNHSGKRKKKQWDGSQYYQDEGHSSKRQKQRQGKQSHADQQGCLHPLYEPSDQNESFQPAEQSAQRLNPPSDDIEVEVSLQLLNDQKEDASVQASQGPEDLAPLPVDPKTLIDLQDGQAEPGMTIAFRELTMSEETKWQPEISVYRTAVVNDVLDRGKLELTLALRDRVRAEKNYDRDTGVRIYGKFDMPIQYEDDVEEEDNGIRHLTFSELVEPKIIQNAPEGLDMKTNQAMSNELAKCSSCEPQTFSHERDNKAADAEFSYVIETPLNLLAFESKMQESVEHLISESPEPSALHGNHELNQAFTSSTAHASVLEAEKQTLKQTSDEKLSKTSVRSEDQGPSSPAARTDEEMEIAEEAALIVEQESTAVADGETFLGQISSESRLKISRIIKEAGFRSSVPSSVIKDIRPNGMESPGDAKVFEKLMREMMEIQSKSPNSPQFHGLDASSPIKKLRTAFVDRQLSSSTVRVPQSSWQTIDSDAASSPPMQDEDESSWQTIDPEELSSVPVRAPSDRIAKATPAWKPHLPIFGSAQEMWQALQPKNRRGSINSTGSSRASPLPSVGLGGSDEKNIATSIQYPKLSVTPSFTSQVSDHGRQPEVTFDDSTITNGDTPKVPAIEDDSFLNRPDNPMTDVEEPELPSYSNLSNSLLDDLSLDGGQRPTGQSIMDGSANSRSKSPDVIPALPSSSENIFPALEDVMSQRGTMKEKNMPLSSKPAKVIKTEKSKRKARSVGMEHSADVCISSRASQKSSEFPESQSPHASQTRKSPRQSKVRGSQPRTNPNHEPQSQPHFPSTQQSVVVDLTLSSSEGEKESRVASEIEEQPKRFRQYKLTEDDDDDFVDDNAGWVPKKSSSQNPVRTRRQSSMGLKASSQSSLNTSRKRTTARF